MGHSYVGQRRLRSNFRLLSSIDGRLLQQLTSIHTQAIIWNDNYQV